MDLPGVEVDVKLNKDKQGMSKKVAFSEHYFMMKRNLQETHLWH